MNVAENFEKIKKEISKKFPNGNKYGEEITIVAASKTVDTESLKQLNGLGIDICGENRVQEFLNKYGKVDTNWHFIGNLQTNKVKYIIDKISLIQSCNSLKLAKVINDLSLKINKISDILIEVNIAKEESKTGISEIELEKGLDDFLILKNIRILGLMAVLPLTDALENTKKYYLQMRTLYDKIKCRISTFKYLSMGMSNDYILAIQCGANMIRLGTALFGERNIKEHASSDAVSL